MKTRVSVRSNSACQKQGISGQRKGSWASMLGSGCRGAAHTTGLPRQEPLHLAPGPAFPLALQEEGWGSAGSPVLELESGQLSPRHLPGAGSPAPTAQTRGEEHSSTDCRARAGPGALPRWTLQPRPRVPAVPSLLSPAHLPGHRFPKSAINGPWDLRVAAWSVPSRLLNKQHPLDILFPAKPSQSRG